MTNVITQVSTYIDGDITYKITPSCGGFYISSSDTKATFRGVRYDSEYDAINSIITHRTKQRVKNEFLVNVFTLIILTMPAIGLILPNAYPSLFQGATIHNQIK